MYRRMERMGPDFLWYRTETLPVLCSVPLTTRHKGDPEMSLHRSHCFSACAAVSANVIGMTTSPSSCGADAGTCDLLSWASTRGVRAARQTTNTRETSG